MCLTATSGVRKSEKDLVVFKVFTHENETFKSPWKATPWKMGETKSVGRFKEQYGPRQFVTNLPYVGVDIGQGLHAYRTKRVALSNIELGDVVARCIIPAGTPYIFGQNSEIVSLKLRFEKVVY